MDAWIDAITRLGFPIVMCGAMGWFVKYQADRSREDLAKVNEHHSHETMELAKAINNNTQALIALKETMKKGE